MLAPFLATSPLTAVFTPAPTPTNEFLGSVSLRARGTDGTFPSPAPITSVSQLTDSSSFGGDIVRIEAGPGGDFGKGVYAISRGGGDQPRTRSTGRGSSTGSIPRPASPPSSST